MAAAPVVVVGVAVSATWALSNLGPQAARTARPAAARASLEALLRGLMLSSSPGKSMNGSGIAGTFLPGGL
jgi:hypothetical protein